MGHSLPPRPRKAGSRQSSLRPRHRQQASWLRRRQDQDRRTREGGHVRSRAIVMQQKTGRPVQFEILEPARITILAWLERRGGAVDALPFPAVSIMPPTSALGSTHASSTSGSSASAYTRRITALTRSDAPRRRSSTNGPAIYAQSRSCLGIPRSRAPFDILVSMSKTL